MTSPSASSDDQTLIAASQRGDASALEALVRRHQDRVYGFAMRMCRKTVPDTFARATPRNSTISDSDSRPHGTDSVRARLMAIKALGCACPTPPSLATR